MTDLTFDIISAVLMGWLDKSQPKREKKKIWTCLFRMVLEVFNKNICIRRNEIGERNQICWLSVRSLAERKTQATRSRRA